VTSARAGHDKSHVPRLDALAGDVRTLRRPRHREVGRVIRTVQLLRFLSDPQLRARTTAATNKAESYNNFAAWCRSGNGGVIADNDPDEQEKIVKFSTLLTNCVVFHTTVDIMAVLRDLMPRAGRSPPRTSRSSRRT
jgi:TnpA family transposase